MNRNSGWIFWSYIGAFTLFLLIPLPSHLFDITGPGPPGLPGPDKAVHVLGYAVFFWLATRKFNSAGRLGPSCLILVAGLIHGGLIEWLQPRISDRTCDARDWMADGIGLLLAFALLWLRGERGGRITTS